MVYFNASDLLYDDAILLGIFYLIRLKQKKQI
jgi:hypothetical protein